MIRKTIIFIFCLFQSQTRDQSEYTNVSHGKAQFLAEKKIEINTKNLYLYGDLQKILRFHENILLTVSSQLKSHADKHSDLRKLRE